VHVFLWSRGVEHGDPSLWNMMYNEELHCGVLSDFDLSVSRRNPWVPGTDRTGTIPFMALALLTDKYWNGEIERKYRHELEAFIWVLPFVFLRYQNGESQQGTPVDPWMTANYHACFNEKSGFRTFPKLPEMKERCQSDFKDHWELAQWLILLLGNIDDKTYYQSTSEVNDSQRLASVWPLFVERLRFAANRQPQLGYINKLIDDLGLESPIWVSNDA
jgi:hypothetical protein